MTLILRMGQSDNFTLGFELGWLFIDLFLGHYVLRIGQLPKLEFEKGDNFEDFIGEE